MDELEGKIQNPISKRREWINTFILIIFMILFGLLIIGLLQTQYGGA